MKTISHAGKSWRIHAATDTKLTFIPRLNPLSRWRAVNKLSQRQAGLRLGVSQALIAKIERGTRVCTPKILAAMSQPETIYKISIDTLTNKC